MSIDSDDKQKADDLLFEAITICKSILAAAGGHLIVTDRGPVNWQQADLDKLDSS